MAAFPRVHAPRRASAIAHPSPLMSATQGNKKERRQTSARGVRWTEKWPALDMSQQSVRSFIATIDRLWSKGEAFTITPYNPYVMHPAAGTILTGSTGAVNGASQTGASLVTDGWSPASGTVKEGDYIVVAGLAYSLWPTADKTASGGAITFDVFPAIASGDAPADDAVVTLNGPLTCVIAAEPRLPEGLDAADVFDGLQLTFEEDV